MSAALAPLAARPGLRAPAAGAPGEPSLREVLVSQPSRFTLDAAIAVMLRASGRADPGQAVRFQAQAGLAFVGADVAAVSQEAGGFRATIGLLGLTGPSGLLPRPYTELVNSERRRRSPALGAFLDLLAQRPIAQFVQAGIKYRPHRAADIAAIGGMTDRAAPADALRGALLALVGHATPGLADRLVTGTDPLLYHAGLFAARPRSADRLGALLSDWLQRPVEVQQFAGHWVRLDRSQRTALPARHAPGQFNRLGVDAAIGSSAWDIQSRIVLRIGPLDRAGFESLMPGGALLPRLVALARTYLDGETDFRIRAVLAAPSVPPAGLGIRAGSRLGWNSWLATRGPRLADADDALFGTDVASGRPDCSPETHPGGGP